MGSRKLGKTREPVQLEALLIGENLDLLWSMPLLLSRAGFAVDTIAVPRVMRLSKFVRSACNVSSFGELMQAARDRICVQTEPYDWVIAADDRTLKNLSTFEWPSSVAPKGFPVASGGCPTHIFSKIGLSQTLLAAGIQTPPFRVAQDAAEALEAAHELGYPVFAKIDASGGGDGTFLCGCDRDIETLELLLPREPMLIQKKIAGQELDLSAIYAERQLIHFAYSEIKRAHPHFGPSIVRTYYPLPLVCPKIFDELASLGQVLDAGGFTTITCIDAADGSGRYYFEADMRPNVWTDFSHFFGEDAAVRIHKWFTSRSRPTQETTMTGTARSPVTMAYFLRLSSWELLLNRYRVWRFIPFADGKVVWRLLLHKLLQGIIRQFLRPKARKRMKSLLRAVGVHPEL